MKITTTQHHHYPHHYHQSLLFAVFGRLSQQIFLSYVTAIC